MADITIPADHAEAALARRLPASRSGKRRGPYRRAIARLERLSPGTLLVGSLGVSLSALGAISVLSVL